MDGFYKLFESTELWAAMLGALIAGIVSWVMHKQNLKEARSQRYNEEKNRKSGLAFSILFKVNIIGGHHRALAKLVDEYLSRQSGSKLGERWEVYTNIIQARREIRFTPEEMSFVMSMKDDELTSKMMLLDENYNYSQILIEVANESKRAFDGSSNEIISEVGPRAAIKISKENYPLLRPHMHSINETFENIVLITQEELPKALYCMSRLVVIFNEQLDLKISVVEAPARFGRA